MVGLWLADIRENHLVFFCLMVPRPESPEWFSVVVPDPSNGLFIPVYCVVCQKVNSGVCEAC